MERLRGRDRAHFRKLISSAKCAPDLHTLNKNEPCSSIPSAELRSNEEEVGILVQAHSLDLPGDSKALLCLLKSSIPSVCSLHDVNYHIFYLKARV